MHISKRSLLSIWTYRVHLNFKKMPSFSPARLFRLLFAQQELKVTDRQCKSVLLLRANRCEICSQLLDRREDQFSNRYRSQACRDAENVRNQLAIPSRTQLTRSMQDRGETVVQTVGQFIPKRYVDAAAGPPLHAANEVRQHDSTKKRTS